MHFFRTASLVEELAAASVDVEKQAQYLLLSMLVWTAAG